MLMFVDESRAKAAASAGPGSSSQAAPSAVAPPPLEVKAALPERLASILKQVSAVSPLGLFIDALGSGLAAAGASRAEDFCDISPEEAQAVWLPLSGCSREFLVRFLQLCEVERRRGQLPAAAVAPSVGVSAVRSAGEAGGGSSRCSCRARGAGRAA